MELPLNTLSQVPPRRHRGEGPPRAHVGSATLTQTHPGARGGSPQAQIGGVMSGPELKLMMEGLKMLGTLQEVQKMPGQGNPSKLSE